MLTARPLSIWDAAFCWRLANDDSVRLASRDPDKPTLFGHLLWVASWLFKRDRQAWIIGDWECYAIHDDGWGGEPCLRWVSMGLARIQADGTVSIATAPEHRGKGVALFGVNVATRFGIGQGWVTPTAHIRTTNKASIGLFAKAGYQMAGARDGWVTMQRRAV